LAARPPKANDDIISAPHYAAAPLSGDIIVTGSPKAAANAGAAVVGGRRLAAAGAPSDTVVLRCGKTTGTAFRIM
jgi:hypothetical protein